MKNQTFDNCRIDGKSQVVLFEFTLFLDIIWGNNKLSWLQNFIDEVVIISALCKVNLRKTHSYPVIRYKSIW